MQIIRVREVTNLKLDDGHPCQSNQDGPCLILDVLITELQLHNTLKGAEQGLIEVKMRGLVPVCQNLR